jgi:multidrug transporter EmrE-like cation transporter
MDFKSLAVGALFGLAAQLITFFQLHAQLKSDYFKEHIWIPALLGIPTSILFMYSVRNMVHAFGGQLWPSRLIGFGIGVIAFTILSYLFFKEPLTIKTIASLLLAVGILVIQILWK